VARSFGVASFCVTLGILERLDDDATGEADQREIVKLGLTGTRYAITDDRATLAAFLCEARRVAVTPPRACASTPGQGTSGEADGAQYGEYADKAREALKTIGRNTRTLMTKAKAQKSGYYLDFLVRKLYLMSQAAGGTAADNSTVSLRRLREFSADSKEHLEALPQGWTAEEASQYVCHRPDWAIFISMYMCLWKEVSDVAEELGELENVLRWLFRNTKSLASAAADFRAKHGLNPHPWVLMREVGWAGAQVKTRKTPPRKRKLLA